MEPVKTVVSPEDQQKINTFARLFDREQQLEHKLKDLKNVLAGYDDAEMDVLESDQTKIPIKYGTLFIMTKPDDVSNLLEKRKDEAKNKQAIAENELSQIKAQMATLRKELYQTFGDNISLEIDKD